MRHDKCETFSRTRCQRGIRARVVRVETYHRKLTPTSKDAAHTITNLATIAVYYEQWHAPMHQGELEGNFACAEVLNSLRSGTVAVETNLCANNIHGA